MALFDSSAGDSSVRAFYDSPCPRTRRSKADLRPLRSRSITIPSETPRRRRREARPPVTFAAAALAIGLTVVAASAVTALRAARVDPATGCRDLALA
jgi:hypothetical protein